MPAATSRLAPAIRCARPGRPRVSRLGHDERGSFIVEAALIAPIFLLLLFVIGETALMFVVERSMDGAVARAADLVRSGHARAAAISGDEFKARLCARLDVLIDCASSDFFMDVRSFDRPADVDISAPLKPDNSYATAPAFDYGEAGDIVIVRVYYQWTTNPLYASLAINSLGNGKRLISAFAAFRNDPFPAGSTGGRAQ